MSIEIKNISKSFGNVKALDNVEVVFESGKIYGLLGRNGAGKSTLLNIISNRLFADEGKVLLDGQDVVENDNALGKMFLMSEVMLYPEDMKIKDVYKWTKELYGKFDMEYAVKLSEMFKLDTKKKVKALSTGYASIFKLIVALSVDVPYIFLDEPVLGLDANHRELFYKLLLENYENNQRTIVISTHLIEEVSGIIEDVIIIKDGKIIKKQSRDELLGEGYTITGAAKDVDDFTRDKNVIGCDLLGNYKSVYVLGKLDKNNIPNGLEISKLDLQKLFIQLTNY